MPNSMLRFEAMMDAARMRMAEQEVDPTTIDPVVVALATQEDPGQVLSAAIAYTWVPREQAQARSAKAELADMPELYDKLYGATDDLRDAEINPDDFERAAKTGLVIEKLKMPARRRGRARLAVASLAMGIGVTMGIGRAGAVSNDAAIAAGAERAPHIDDRILPGFNLIADPSILSGDTGAGLPVIGPVLSHVPGIPDHEPVPHKMRHQELKTIETKTTKLQASYQAGNVQNPVSYDLALTGVEYGQGRLAAREFLAQVSDGSTLKTLRLDGKVSDEFQCHVGERNPQQQVLIDARTNIAAKAMFDEALAEGIPLPSGIASPEAIPQSGEEVVLSADDQAELHRKLAGRDLCAELTKFNAGTLADAELGTFFQRTIGVNRGATFTGTAEKNVETTTVKAIPEAQSNMLFLEWPGEILTLSYAGITLFMGGLIGAGRRRPRDVKRQAQKLAREAGLNVNQE
jgi:hypothetical protein